MPPRSTPVTARSPLGPARSLARAALLSAVAAACGPTAGQSSGTASDVPAAASLPSDGGAARAAPRDPYVTPEEKAAGPEQFGPPSPAALVALPVPAYGDAVVALPSGAGASPVVVALHGNFDRPEWLCAALRGALGSERGVVLCPRGVRRADAGDAAPRHTWGSAEATAAEVRAALSALEAAHGERTEPAPLVLAGFSLGANRAAAIAQQEPATFPAVLLIDGAYERWTATVASVFAERGGKRLLVACGQTACSLQRERLEYLGARHGFAVRVAATDAGHRYDGAMGAAIGAEWDWLTADDPRWRGGATEPDAPAAPSAATPPR